MLQQASLAAQLLGQCRVQTPCTLEVLANCIQKWNVQYALGQMHLTAEALSCNDIGDVHGSYKVVRQVTLPET